MSLGYLIAGFKKEIERRKGLRGCYSPLAVDLSLEDSFLSLRLRGMEYIGFGYLSDECRDYELL